MGVGQRVRPTGPTPARIMVIGDWAGKDEARRGRPFAGKVGGEIDRYFDGVRLPSRDDVYLTYFIKDWCGEDGEYTQADFDRDEPELRAEIAAVQPEIIVALGRHTARWLLGDIDLDETYALPWRLHAPTRELFVAPETVAVFVGYSPGAGFRSPDISARITYQFTQLESVLDGSLVPRALWDDPFPWPVYFEPTLAQLEHFMEKSVEIGVDSEGYAWAPWSVQVSSADGNAFVIRYRNGSTLNPVLQRFAELVNAEPTRWSWIFHNGLHDLSIFRAIGIDTTRLRYDDTMLMAYALQLEPQGLKPLCARWCDMRMSHYLDVMGDAENRLATDWLIGVYEAETDGWLTRCHEEFIRLTTTPYVDGRGKTQPGRRLKVDPKLPRTNLHTAVERCLKSKRPRGLWMDQVEDVHDAAWRAYGHMWDASLDHVPLHTAIAYAGRDADGTYRLKPKLLARVQDHDLEEVYRADMGTVPLIDRMQQIGVLPDLAHFRTLSHDLDIEIADIRCRLAERLVAAGAHADLDAAFAFNPNSGPQTADTLFARFQIASLKKTPGGDASTNDKVLEALEKDAKLDRGVRDIIHDIREYREVYKLKSTFVDQIPDFVNRWPHDGRIHATFRITRVVTGRLAASDPNLLAMPKHGKFAKRFRAGFVSRDDTWIASWDLSQIELRVLAHLSQDPVLLNAFRTGQDLHAGLSVRIFGGKEEDHKDGVTRLAAKAINFGIPMGMTHIGLCLELRKNGVDVNEDDAQRWLTETMALYRDVPVYQQGKIAEAKRHGFVTDLRGRRRYIGGIRSYDDATRSEAERFAFSTPIQAGAQEVMHEAEAYVYRDILLPYWATKVHCEPLIQIHDDLVMEVDKTRILDLDTKMRHAMTKVPARWLSVPIETSGDFGPNWGALAPISCGKCGKPNATHEHKICGVCGGKL